MEESVLALDKPSIVVALDKADIYNLLSRLKEQYPDAEIISFPSFYLARNQVLGAKNLKGIIAVAENDLGGEDKQSFKMLVEAGLYSEAKIVIIYTTFIRTELMGVLGKLLDNKNIILVEQIKLVREGVEAVLGNIFQSVLS